MRSGSFLFISFKINLSCSFQLHNCPFDIEFKLKHIQMDNIHTSSYVMHHDLLEDMLFNLLNFLIKL